MVECNGFNLDLRGLKIFRLDGIVVEFNKKWMRLFQMIARVILEEKIN